MDRPQPRQRQPWPPRRKGTERMPPALELRGRTFGQLVALRSIHLIKTRRTGWYCECWECGAGHIVATDALMSGEATGRGCHLDPARFSEGCKTTRTYRIWRKMRERCRKSDAPSFRHYGGRGITVCDRWQEFRCFVADMGPCPSSRHSIERKDNNGNYEPTNCKWATQAEQNRNKRNIKLIEHNGRAMCLTDWSKQTGISVPALRHRLASGWEVCRALTERVRPRPQPLPPPPQFGPTEALPQE